MLNFRLLYILISPRSIRTFLGIIATLGLGVLLDIILFLKMSLMVGPWITMAVLAANTALGVFIMYRLTELRGRRLVETIDDGHFDPDLFSRYLSTLVASLFLIIPGILNTLAGILLLIPYIGTGLGIRLAGMAGIDWQEAYEFLRLDRMTGNRLDINAES
jgi:UPF0716 family protein affecting phage T7 exclusion